MPNTAELVEPRLVTERAPRVRKRRDDLIPLFEDLAYNLRWSWHPPTLDLFQRLAPVPWARTHNPIAAFKAAMNEPDRLAEHAESIVERHSDLEQYLNRPPHLQHIPRIGYFCAEFAIAESLPIYSGGLGVLAGDHLKAASDLGLPLVAVGLLYRYGYFRQVIDDTGYQREAYDRLETDGVAVRPVLNAHWPREPRRPSTTLFSNRLRTSPSPRTRLSRQATMPSIRIWSRRTSAAIASSSASPMLSSCSTAAAILKRPGSRSR